MSSSPSPSASLKPYVISFRKDLHVFPPAECVTFRDYSARPYWLPSESIQEIYQILTGIFISGYLFWGWFVGALLVFLYWIGYWWISALVIAAYIPYFLTPFHTKYLGRPWDAVRTSFLWHSIQQYCNMEVIRLSSPLDPSRRYIFGFYPHNLLLLSRVSMYGNVFDELFPGIDFRVLGASTMFYIPMCRELCLYLGAVDAGKKTAVQILKSNSTSEDPTKKGNPISLFIYPGGVSEMLLTSDTKKEITLVPRKGFIKLSLQYGADLIPSFVFNEEKMYKKVHSNWALKSETFLWKKLKFPWVWFYGRFCTLLSYQPKGRPLTVIFGQPIRIETKIENPTDKEIDEYYEKYHNATIQLFEQFKLKLGYEKDDVLVLKPPTAENEKNNNKHSKDE